ncbi:hypothetical protein Y032_0041g435 [Ancylostoma ceylanicum]|uniref:Uncharacterized protein n=1 Tax=Ancylostoma ceylanicum TaxID=53326 RepID=A0A016UI09_9BILA|nr:hypothetical protein Y032_0041g435 [Ancylostoma ceylanicum]
MIRRSLVQIRLYSQKVDPTQAFDFIPAKMGDLADVVDLCTSGLIHDEPHSRALKLTPQGSRGLFEYIAAKALHYPYSYRIHEKVSLTHNEKITHVLPMGSHERFSDISASKSIRKNDIELEQKCERALNFGCGALYPEKAALSRSTIGRLSELTNRSSWSRPFRRYNAPQP